MIKGTSKYSVAAKLAATLLALFLVFPLGCHRKGHDFILQDERVLRLALNKGVRSIANIDTVLCRLAMGAEGKVYFDDMLWENLTEFTKNNLSRCLNDERHLKVTALPAVLPEPIRQITARNPPSEKMLYVGWVRSNCLVCDIETGIAEFRLVQTGTLFTAVEVPKEELWR